MSTALYVVAGALLLAGVASVALVVALWWLDRRDAVPGCMCEDCDIEMGVESLGPVDAVDEHARTVMAALSPDSLSDLSAEEQRAWDEIVAWLRIGDVPYVLPNPPSTEETQ